MNKSLQVIHEYCIHCGVCVMMEYAINRDGKKYIKEDLPKEKRLEAETSCPVWAIQEIDDKELK